MRLQESGEMYLETIYVLSKKKANVRSVDISEEMGFSKPSVSRAIGLLKSGGFITVDDSGFIRLTAEGLDVAEKMYERHTLLAGMLEAFGVPRDIAAEDACKIEHHISDISFEKIKEHMRTYREEA